MSTVITVGNLYSSIRSDPPLSDIVMYQITKSLSYKLQDAKYMLRAMYGNMPKSDKPEWDGTVKLFWPEKGNLFYTGMLSEVRRLLDESGVQYEFEIMRQRPPENMPGLALVRPDGIEDREYQAVTVQMLYEATRGVMQAATGSGKTFIISDLISRIKTSPFIFYVLSVDLLQQAHGELSRFLNVPIGIVGAGKVDIRDINVVMIQTAIRSVHRKDPQFDINAYKYDDEDQWLEESEEEKAKADQIETLVRNARGIYFDECISGNSEIITDKGIIPISEVITSGCRRVMTYDGGKVCFRKITNWWKKGRRKTIRLSFGNKTHLACTPEHLLWTEKGWKKAGEIQRGERVFCANAAAAHCWKKTSTEEKEDLYLAIRSKKEVYRNGIKDISGVSHLRPCVPVDAAVTSPQGTKALKSLSKIGGALDIPNTFSDMTNSHLGKNTSLKLARKKFKPLLAHALETPVSLFQTKGLKITDLSPITVQNKSRGLNTRLSFCPDIRLKSKSKKTLGSDCYGQACAQDACLLLPPSRPCSTEANVRLSQKIFWTSSERLVSLGGFATTEAIREDICPSPLIPKAGQCLKTRSCLGGFAERDSIAELQKANRDRISFSALKGLSTCLTSSDPIFRSACPTSWQTVTKITDAGEQDVYDIEVSSAHSFFANGVLVHNCHHVAAKTCQEVLEYSKLAYWRYGGSATPTRDDGQEPMIQALFGKKIVDISASLLIQLGYLVQPYIFIVKMDDFHGDFVSYSRIYKNYIVENKKLNELVSKTIKFFEGKHITGLTLVKQYAQGEAIKELHGDIPFIRGDQTKKKRLGYLDGLRSGEVISSIATTLADEGLDVRRLSAVIVAGGGKSQTRVYQRIGRALRSFKDEATGKIKDKAVIVLFHHNCRYLEKHGSVIRRLLSKEKAFIIKDTTPENLFTCISDVISPDLGFLEFSGNEPGQ